MSRAHYRSVRRQQQAEATRRDILAAARRLFGEKGYGSTSMADIAEAAGTAVQTIYTSVGSKLAVMAALNDQVDEDVGVAELAPQAFTSTDPRRTIDLSVRIVAAFVERAGDMVRAALSAAGVEPAMAAFIEEGRRRHTAGMTRVAARLRELDALRDDLTVEQAGALFATIVSADAVLLLTGTYGWTLDEAHRWLTETSCRTLLKRAGRRG